MKRIPAHYCIDIQDRTARYLELLCAQYQLTDEQLMAHALKLTELHLAEQEARLDAMGGFDED